MRLRQKLASFMYGRYGADALYWFSFGVVFFLWILRMVFAFIGIWIAELILSMLSTVILVLAVFRFMSKNIYKRSAENRKFLQIFGGIKSSFSLMRDKYRDRKTHVFRKCPSCKANLRLPKKSGEHTVKCPRCSNRFDVKIR